MRSCGFDERLHGETGTDVGVGRGSASIWTCDLTKRYVEINGEERS
jgi:glutamate N-acetyltransferase/amino-acid N-acetyltransferase